MRGKLIIIKCVCDADLRIIHGHKQIASIITLHDANELYLRYEQ